jgi:hypothetical protein
MDPLTAFSLAGTVIQFVDFGGKLISGGQGLYAKGHLDIHCQIKAAVDDLLDYATKLQRTIRAPEALGLPYRG